MEVCVLGFASVREILGAERRLELPDGASVADLWSSLEREYPALAGHRASTRIARNGQLTDAATTLADGDEVAILPPVGGG